MTMQGLYDFLELPLVLTDEVHTRADKAAVEMRRIVGELLSHSQRRLGATPTSGDGVRAPTGRRSARLPAPGVNVDGRGAAR
jgi:hypothetical protein